jgi:hypothetical protein
MNSYEEMPVYLIASERSGTNLLRKRLTACQGVYFGPAPAHFLKHLYYREPFYGDLSVDSVFARLVSDALDLCLVHFSPWKTGLDVDKVMASYGDRPRNVIQVAHFLMVLHAREVGYQGYFCKDNQLFDFTTDIVRQIPGAKFIYLYRDPRDFVLSQRKRVAASRSVIRHARLWRDEQLKSIRAANELRLEGRCHFVSYESLLQDEAATLSEVCSYLGVKMESPAQVPDDAVTELVHDWQNLGQTTMRQNHGKFMKELSPSSNGRIEVICAEPMRWLGYPRVTGRERPIGVGEAVGAYALDAVASLGARLLPRGTKEQRERSRLLRRLGTHRPRTA